MSTFSRTAVGPHQPIRTIPNRSSERGQAGIEVLAFGFLVFVAGSLLIVNVWAIIDARFAVNSAATEAARAYVESDTAELAGAAAQHAALETMQAYGRDENDRLTIEAVDLAGGRFGRCVRVRLSVQYEVPALSLPFIGGLGNGFTVRATRSERIDPYRDGLEEGSC
jgi:Flp pilus assembly protein TadG